VAAALLLIERRRAGQSTAVMPLGSMVNQGSRSFKEVTGNRAAAGAASADMNCRRPILLTIRPACNLTKNITP
jgi:hypothetical protein